LRRRSIARRISLIEPTIRIGKKGVTEAQIKEIMKQLEVRRTVKVRVLRSALASESLENIAQRISAETNLKIIQIIGHTFTLHKPREKRRKTVKKN